MSTRAYELRGHVRDGVILTLAILTAVGGYLSHEITWLLVGV